MLQVLRELIIGKNVLISFEVQVSLGSKNSFATSKFALNFRTPSTLCLSSFVKWKSLIFLKYHNWRCEEIYSFSMWSLK